ncbi:hypothetical protein J2TS6_52690 [Paenibacillus albilobatus]|uniref:Uncharacterized protein n=1 Tax=Paenibacillus albilobatus TaxID=2716884 RepID=A0A919XQ03_9BACL|nr:hypothetical protein J2TS6_52690 [Paenibacillus albilobatus]
MLSELLYNVPPLYHIDPDNWQRNKKLIADYVKVWSPFHEKAVTRPMTSFRICSPDRLVQFASYGDKLRITVNFSSKDFADRQRTIPARSAVIEDGGKVITYRAPNV